MFPFLSEQWADQSTESNYELQELENFPYTKYQNLMATYREAEAWFTGANLEARNKQNDEIYPLKVNPIIATCLKHAYMLFGEPENDGRPQVYPKLSAAVALKEPGKKLVEEAETALTKVWHQSAGRALLIESGILSQIYGGTILKVNWDGTRRDPLNEFSQCRLESLPATAFYGIPYPGEYYRLKEAWIIKNLEDSQAAGLGYKPNGVDDNWFVEHWTESRFSQKINGTHLVKTVNGRKLPLSGKNKLGTVPIVYIPHLRIGTFFGINTFDHLLGLIKEINLRYADYGDAVNDDSHVTVAMRNVSGSPKMRTIGGGYQVIDIGSGRSITGNEPEPDLFEVSKTTKASSAMKDLSDVLYDQYRRDAAHPAVADGEDEGSQRSGLTIAMRFWPMTSHISTERYFWTPALDRINEIILRTLITHKKGGLSDEHLQLSMKQKWAPLLPRDREADVTEWVARASANLGSIDTLLEQTGDIDDIPGEKLKILDWIKSIAEITAEVEARYAKVVDDKPENKSNKEKDSKKKTETDDKVKPNHD